jgi:hypothetical protein
VLDGSAYHAGCQSIATVDLKAGVVGAQPMRGAIGVSPQFNFFPTGAEQPARDAQRQPATIIAVAYQLETRRHETQRESHTDYTRGEPHSPA